MKPDPTTIEYKIKIPTHVKFIIAKALLKYCKSKF